MGQSKGKSQTSRQKTAASQAAATGKSTRGRKKKAPSPPESDSSEIIQDSNSDATSGEVQEAMQQEMGGASAANVSTMFMYLCNCFPPV